MLVDNLWFYEDCKELEKKQYKKQSNIPKPEEPEEVVLAKFNLNELNFAKLEPVWQHKIP